MTEEDRKKAAEIVKRCGLRDGLFKGPRTLNAVETVLAALTEARAEQRETNAAIEFANIIPVDHGWTVSVGSLGLKLCGTEGAARSICKAINDNIAGLIRGR